MPLFFAIFLLIGSASIVIVSGSGNTYFCIDDGLSNAEPSIPGGINGDGVVNVVDLLILLAEWGETDSSADINGDGFVNVEDLLILLGNGG